MKMFCLLTALRTFLLEMLLRVQSSQLFSRRQLAWLTCEFSSVSLSVSRVCVFSNFSFMSLDIRERQMLCIKAPLMPWISLGRAWLCSELSWATRIKSKNWLETLKTCESLMHDDWFFTRQLHYATPLTGVRSPLHTDLQMFRFLLLSSACHLSLSSSLWGQICEEWLLFYSGDLNEAPALTVK